MILHSSALIEEYTRAGHWGRQTLLDRLRENLAHCPDRTAVVDPPDRPDLVGSPSRSVTWAELGRAAEAVATALVDRGLREDEVVVLQLPNVWELVMLYLAVARAGGIPSPLPVQWRRHELKDVAAATGARFYIGGEQFKGFDHQAMARGIAGETRLETFLSLDEVSALATGEADTDRLDGIPVDANDIFTLCWTSGTEAGPKGCPLSHNNWLFGSGNLTRLMRLEDGDRLLCAAPMVNMTGVGVLLVPWMLCAGTLLMHHPLNMQLLLRQLTTENVQFTILVPALLNMIGKHPDVDALDLSSVRTICTGSAPPSAWSLQEFKRRWDIEINNLWGQNEGTSLIGGPQDVPDLERRVDHLPWWGRAGCDWPSGIEGVQVKLVDGEGRECREPGDVGELAYRGPNLFPGYYGRDDLNARAFDAEGYYCTGDLFRVMDACHVGFFDRKKDIIIRGGFNISAAEVENLALSHPGIADAAAVAVPDETMGERVCLCIVARDPANPPALADVTGFLREQGIATYKLPEALLRLEEIPRNPVGKVLKKDLRQRARDEAARNG